MNRSNFFKKLASLGIWIGLGNQFSFGHRPKVNPYRIGIIGAGITGLYLARSLQLQGHSISIFEAKNRAGGRIYYNDNFFSSPIDIGAQWIHGKNELYHLVKKSKVPIYRDTRNDLIKVAYKDQLLNDFPPEFYHFIDTITNKTPLVEDMAVLDFAQSFSSDPAFISLVENAVTDAATSAGHLSVNEISSLTRKIKTNDYQFAGTTMYQFLASNYLEQLRGSIRFNTAIRAIDYTGSTIVLTGDNNQSFDVDKVIITIPITELKSNKILFYPELPTQKIAAFNQLGMDKGMKLFLKFEQRFYKHSIFNGKYAGYYIDPTKRNDNSTQGLLASLIMGKHAMLYYQNPDKAIQHYLSELDTLFKGQASRYFSGAFVQDWGSESYINGVYSYTLPGGQLARATARQPINNRVFFAGEAMNTKKNYGNVHGAIESAIDLLNELK